jgi:FkbM family methyltransferase
MSLLTTLMLHWRRLLNRQSINYDGVTISTDPNLIPRSVRSALFKERYEEHERKLVRGLLGPGDRVLEIGAGIGFISVLCARICGEGNVRSHEANLRLEPVIRRNYALNGIKPDLRMRAITADGQPVSFFRDDNIVSSSTLERPRAAEKITVESDPIDQAIDEHRANVIIMDVEGAETSLLTGSQLRGVKHIIVEVHPHITGEEPVAAMSESLIARGFDLKDRAHKTLVFSRA